MAAGNGAIYNSFKRYLMDHTIDLDGDTLKVCLVTEYTPDIDEETLYSHVSGYEVSGSGYTAGGESVTGTVIIPDVANDKAIFDFEDTEWEALDVGDLSHAVLYSDTPVSKPLIAYWELTAPSIGGNYALQWGSGGVMTLS